MTLDANVYLFRYFKKSATRFTLKYVPKPSIVFTDQSKGLSTAGTIQVAIWLQELLFKTHVTAAVMLDNLSLLKIGGATMRACLLSYVYGGFALWTYKLLPYLFFDKNSLFFKFL